ncbi:hypothetical protein DY000_02042627 [Brassica cretica]|uniref:Uncharacterized protein n=1 Tax=Brassica cretica TaxID=69181 RepID=A0ABQ7BE08_BRACR|nr:hypothetical protein DY000_02042627 [Brassica cretica]
MLSARNSKTPRAKNPNRQNTKNPNPSRRTLIPIASLAFRSEAFPTRLSFRRSQLRRPKPQLASGSARVPDQTIRDPIDATPFATASARDISLNPFRRSQLRRPKPQLASGSARVPDQTIRDPIDATPFATASARDISLNPFATR